MISKIPTSKSNVKLKSKQSNTNSSKFYFKLNKNFHQNKCKIVNNITVYFLGIENVSQGIRNIIKFYFKDIRAREGGDIGTFITLVPNIL